MSLCKHGKGGRETETWNRSASQVPGTPQWSQRRLGSAVPPGAGAAQGAWWRQFQAAKGTLAPMEYTHWGPEQSLRFWSGGDNASREHP